LNVLTEATLGPVFAENGFYVAAKARIEAYRHRIRTHFLARALGVRAVYIGPESYLRGLKHIQLGENFGAARGLWLEAIIEYREEKFSPKIIIGDDVTLSFWSHIAAVNHVEIGSGTLIGSKVIITDHNHGHYGPDIHSSSLVPPALRELSRGRVVIGRNVWIGDGVVIGPGADIGEGSVIGANAVVVGPVAPNTVAVGMPAKPIKTYDFDRMCWVRISE
jgi:lipopolysaccharide O-acetyltransferase